MRVPAAAAAAGGFAPMAAPNSNGTSASNAVQQPGAMPGTMPGAAVIPRGVVSPAAMPGTMPGATAFAQTATATAVPGGLSPSATAAVATAATPAQGTVTNRPAAAGVFVNTPGLPPGMMIPKQVVRGAAAEMSGGNATMPPRMMINNTQPTPPSNDVAVQSFPNMFGGSAVPAPFGALRPQATVPAPAAVPAGVGALLPPGFRLVAPTAPPSVAAGGLYQ